MRDEVEKLEAKMEEMVEKIRELTDECENLFGILDDGENQAAHNVGPEVLIIRELLESFEQ